MDKIVIIDSEQLSEVMAEVFQEQAIEISDKFGEDFVAVHSPSEEIVNSEDAVIVSICEHKIAVVDKKILGKVKLFESNSKILGEILKLNYAISALRKPVTLNKLNGQNIKSILDHMAVVILNLEKTKNHKTAKFLHRIFLDEKFAKSVASIKKKDGEFGSLERKYLMDAIERLSSDPYDFSFYDESKIYAETE